MAGLSLLIVDDEPLMQRSLSALFKRYGESHIAESIAAARHALDRQWDGIILDIRLSDGSGLDLLERARKLHLRVPVAVVSGVIDNAAINRVLQLDAWLISKPCGAAEFAGFLGEVVERKTGDRLKAAIQRARNRWKLSERETELVRQAMRGMTREDFIAKAGVSANTYKTQVRRLLIKTSHRSLVELALALLTES